MAIEFCRKFLYKDFTTDGIFSSSLAFTVSRNYCQRRNVMNDLIIKCFVQVSWVLDPFDFARQSYAISEVVDGVVAVSSLNWSFD